MGTINNPSKFNPLAALKPDEPFFVLRGQDKLAAKRVRDWAADAHLHGVPMAKVEEAWQLASQMEAFAAVHGKVPD